MRRGRAEFMNEPPKEWLAESYLVALTWYVIVGAICFGLATGGFALMKGVHNDNIDARVTFGKLLLVDGPNSPRVDLAEVRAKRQRIAREFVSVYDQEDSTFGHDSDDTSYWEDHIDEIRTVADTGILPDLGNLQKRSFKSFWGFFQLWYIQLGIFLAFGLTYLLCYAHYRFEDWRGTEPYLAEFPWNMKSTWIPILTLGPLFWICLLVSYWLLPERETIEPNNHIVTEVEVVGKATHVARTRTVRQERAAGLKGYSSSPVEARAFYQALRTGLALKVRKRRLEEIDDEIEYTRDDMRTAGETIKEGSRKLNELTAEKQELEKAGETPEVTDANKLGEEFDRMMTLPGVIAVQVTGDDIRLIVRATTEYKGKLYYLGDWEMHFGPEITSIYAQELVSGVRRSWNGGYPVYRLRSDEFCFGERRSTIDQHLVKGQYLEAMALATECLCTANEQDKKFIPQAFKEVRADGA